MCYFADSVDGFHLLPGKNLEFMGWCEPEIFVSGIWRFTVQED